ncbi:hypothetical protein JZU61_04610, partial [bacterium]|nr:hypothetical protein [bacterium]
FQSDGVPPPAPARVTQTVSLLNARQSLDENRKSHSGDNMKINGAFSFLVALVLLTSSGCGTSPQSSSPNPQIEIEITGTESKELESQTISQPNCTGSAEVENVVEKARQITYVMEIQNGTQANTNGQVGFAGTDIELGATISSQFGQSYGMSETISRSLIVKTSPGKNMQHIVKQQEIWKIGNAKISVGEQQIIIPFKYRYDFTIELVNSVDLGNCDTLVADPAPTNSVNETPVNSQQPNQPVSCFPQTGWTPPTLTPQGEWQYDCLSSGEGNWVGQDEAWKATNWKRGSSQSEIVAIVIPEGATKMGLGCDPCTILKPDGGSISSPNGNFGSFRPNISLDVKSGEIYKVKIFGGDTCPTRPQAIPPCSPEIYIWFNLP